MASLCPVAKAAEEALFHTVPVMASHSPKTAVEGTHHCTVAGAGVVEAAVYVHNMPHRGSGVMSTAGTLCR